VSQILVSSRTCFVQVLRKEGVKYHGVEACESKLFIMNQVLLVDDMYCVLFKNIYCCKFYEFKM